MQFLGYKRKEGRAGLRNHVLILPTCACGSESCRVVATQAAELNGYLEANAYTSFTVALTDPMKARLPMLIAVMVYCIFFAAKFTPDTPVVEVVALESRKDNRLPSPPSRSGPGT